MSRTGAVFIENSENVVVAGNTFERIDGNALMISGYNRNTMVDGNEFYKIGENAILSWGKTADWPDAERETPIPEGQGPDASNGYHPQGNVISNNFIHEIGHFQKQVRVLYEY